MPITGAISLNRAKTEQPPRHANTPYPPPPAWDRGGPYLVDLMNHDLAEGIKYSVFQYGGIWTCEAKSVDRTVEFTVYGFGNTHSDALEDAQKEFKNLQARLISHLNARGNQNTKAKSA